MNPNLYVEKVRSNSVTKYSKRRESKFDRDYSFETRLLRTPNCKILSTCHEDVAKLPRQVNDHWIKDVCLEPHVPLAELQVVVDNLPSENNDRLVYTISNCNSNTTLYKAMRLLFLSLDN